MTKRSLALFLRLICFLVALATNGSGQEPKPFAPDKMDTVLYGVAYYPEYMPYDRLDKDVELMPEVGLQEVISALGIDSGRITGESRKSRHSWVYGSDLDVITELAKRSCQIPPAMFLQFGIAFRTLLNESNTFMQDVRRCDVAPLPVPSTIGPPEPKNLKNRWQFGNQPLTISPVPRSSCSIPPAPSAG